VAKSADRERVTIYWYVVPNANERRGGWMPVYDHNGRLRGNTYGRGYELETALRMAKADAEEEAGRYVGDWDVIVAQKPGSPEPSRLTLRMGRSRKEREDLPWQNSYANWTIRVGEAAARHNATIAFGAETHDAWKAGVSPDDYARARARAK
jgi:hypothetical protein